MLQREIELLAQARPYRVAVEGNVNLSFVVNWILEGCDTCARSTGASPEERISSWWFDGLQTCQS